MADWSWNYSWGWVNTIAPVTHNIWHIRHIWHNILHIWHIGHNIYGFMLITHVLPQSLLSSNTWRNEMVQRDATCLQGRKELEQSSWWHTFTDHQESFPVVKHCIKVSTLRLFSCQLARVNLGKTPTFCYVFQIFAIFYEGLEILGIFWGQVLWYWNEPGGHGAVPSPGSNSHTSLTGAWKRLESNPGEEEKITWGGRIARGWGRDDRGGCCDWEFYLLMWWLLVILLCEINILLWEYGKKMIKV